MAKFPTIEEMATEIKDNVIKVIEEETGVPFARIVELAFADVAPVVHGRWISTIESNGWNDVDCVECSECGESWVIDEYFDFDMFNEDWRYCPNCGAKMDLEGEA